MEYITAAHDLLMAAQSMVQTSITTSSIKTAEKILYMEMRTGDTETLVLKIQTVQTLFDLVYTFGQLMASFDFLS